MSVYSQTGPTKKTGSYKGKSNKPGDKVVPKQSVSRQKNIRGGK